MVKRHRTYLKGILQVYRRLFYGGRLAPGQGTILRPLPPTQKGSLGGQGGLAIGLYGLPPGPLLQGHQPPFGWLSELHQVDQEGELLSWGSSLTGLPPGMPTPAGSPLAQMAPVGSQRVPLGIADED